jgi:ubiquinone/menaquinone biosynthesis C-methylase UbiE
MKYSTVVERISVQPKSLFYREHEARYHFAASYLRPGLTLDIACGTGYGTQQLAKVPGVRAVGADIFLPALRDARQTYSDAQLGYVAASGPALPFPAHAAQNIVTLETLEHIADACGYLREIARVLHPTGLCVLSTPDRAYSLRHQIANPYHVHEYSPAELLSLLGEFFATVDLYYQGFSANYHAQVRSYAAVIQTRKKTLSPATQFVVDHMYRPIRSRLPKNVANFFIRKLLGLSYPQPDPADIAITKEPAEDTSTLIVICQKSPDPEPRLLLRPPLLVSNLS